MRPTTTAAALAVTAVLSLAACGSDGDDSADTPPTDPTVAAPDTTAPATSEPVATIEPVEVTAPPGDEVVEVALADYSFGDVPDEVAAGTRLAIDNQSPTELHELVAVRLADDDERPASAIIESGLPELLASTPPSAVLLAAPGGDQINAVGDGVLVEPGRYLLLCAIPTGADPGEYLAAAAESTDGPPQVDGGPPHFVYGMVDEIIVTP